VNRLRRFASESWSAHKKVTWPNRIQVRNLTVLVFVVSFVVGLFITVVDSGFDIIIRTLADLA
jgi:preprotein translocase SecE subunit